VTTHFRAESKPGKMLVTCDFAYNSNKCSVGAKRSMHAPVFMVVTMIVQSQAVTWLGSILPLFRCEARQIPGRRCFHAVATLLLLPLPRQEEAGKLYG
jgi:hypothetical protein